jgi:hypothetical protein
MRKDVTGGYGASSSVWRSLPESEMCAVLVVVANILREPAFQVAFVNCDDVIQEITPATPYPTLCDSILPRTFERSAERIHPQGSNRCGDLQSILGITIKDDKPRSGSKWKCFSQLPRRTTRITIAVCIGYPEPPRIHSSPVLLRPSLANRDRIPNL